MAAIQTHRQIGRDGSCYPSKIQKWTTGLDDIALFSAKRRASSCTWRNQKPFESSGQVHVAAEKCKLDVSEVFTLTETIPILSIDPPPCYDDAIIDTPPAYDLRANHDTVYPGHEQQAQPPAYEYIPEKSTHRGEPATAPSIDFNDTSKFRQAANKKAKKAQKQADQAKWAEDGEDGNKEGDEGEQNGGNGGGSNNGDGGAGDGGGGGDDWGNWDTGNKKKKGKKGKEEEKKKQEEEEERKRQEEEAANATITNPLSWADEANGDLGDDWGGFTSTTKKDKKGKKGKGESGNEKSNNASNFDNIDLNDDAPKLLDLDFGTNEKKESGFGFGGWGAANNTWSTGNTWSFGNDTGTADIADSLAKATTTDATDGSSWSFGGSKKNKKKTTNTGGFDFGDFGTLDEEQNPESRADETTLGGDDSWGADLTGTGKKGKKDKKKGTFEDTSNDPDTGAIGTAIADHEPVADDSWGIGWGATATKSKKKGKKGEEEPAAPPPPPVPAAPSDTFTGDDWGGFASKKDKKKGKKTNEVDGPAISVVPDADVEADVGWGSFGKKDKKKGGKKEAEKVEEPAVTALPEPDLELDFGWGASKTDKKKAKKDTKIDEPATTGIPDVDPTADTGWGMFGKKGKKGVKKEGDKIEETPANKEPESEPKQDEWSAFGTKDKKKKKSIWDEPEKEEKLAVEETPEADTTADPGWGVFGTKKKKGKRGVLDDITSHPPPPPDVEPVEEEKPSLIRAESKKDKKGKKGVISEVKDDVTPATDVTTSVAADDDWISGWGGTDKKKDKKSKRNSMASSKGEDAPPPPPPVPAVPDVPDASSFDIWGSSKKEKDKKGKKGKVTEPEPDLLALDDPIDAKNEQGEDDWAASTWGLSTKDKKKKEKEREKAKKEKEEKERQEKEEQERKEEEERIAREEEEETAAKAKEKATTKGKGKKGKTNVSPEISKTKDLLADSVPDIAPVGEEDSWGSSWGVPKKDKKKGKKDMEFELPPPAPTPPAQGLTPEPEENDDEWASFAPAKPTIKGKKDTKTGKKGAKEAVDEWAADDKPEKDGFKKNASAKDDTPAKAVKSFWGDTTATSNSKLKTSKAEEKAKKEAEAVAAAAAELDLDEDEIVETVEEPAKKTAKDKVGGKLSKTSTKESDKSSKLADAKKLGLANGEVPVAKGKEGKSKAASKDEEDTTTTTAANNTVTSSLWGSSKKTSGNSGKKGDEAKNKIGKEGLTNHKASVNIGAWNEPEATEVEDEDDQPSTVQPAKSKKSAMSTTKTSKQSSVLQRVKELEKNKASDSIPAPPSPDPEPISKPEKKGATNKTKELASGRSLSSKKKDLLSQSVDNKKGPKDSVPGSFPGEGEVDGMDDELADLVDSPPIEKQESKGSKKGFKSTKDSKIASKTRDTPESKRPPTPPPEPKEEKPAKKERPRVVKAGGASSWGMWGAAAPAKDKKVTKSKDDADISPPPKKEKAPAPGLVRSKSTKTAREKDKETVRSSDSDKPKKAESRPPKSRGSSFGGLFGGAPARTKSVRRNSTAASGPKNGSRQASMDIDATGLPSPPAEDAPEVNSKAAKLIGLSGGKLDRKASTKGKQKISAAPDPYAIDSDDMVMVNGLDDPVTNVPSPKKGKDKGSKTKSKEIHPEPTSIRKDLPDRTRTKGDSKAEPSKPKRQSKAFNEDEDIVMVDGGPSDEPEVADGPDDMQFITKPKGLQRSATSSKRPESKMGGLFGAFRKSKTPAESGDRLKSRGNVDGEVPPRKRTVTGGDEYAKRPRRDDRRRPEKTTSRAAEGYVYNTEADGAGATEAEDAGARKEERRAKKADKDRAAREAEALKYENDRRAKRRTAEKDKSKEQDRKAKQVNDAEAKAQEDREARRAARRAREEQENRELEEDILKPRLKRRDTGRNTEQPSRPDKSDRRRSHYDKPVTSQTPDDEEARQVRRDQRRAKADRRKSTAAAPVEDYFDPRNGKRGNNDPYSNGGNGKDHTASWVESLAKESPEPPPFEPTIMEPAPDMRPDGGGGSSGAADDPAADEAFRRSSKRKSKRSSRMYADEGDGYRSPPTPTRRQSELGGVKLGSGTKVFDGKTGQGKRSSWFQKIGGRS